MISAFDRGWAPQDFHDYGLDWLADNAPPPPFERLPITPPEVMTVVQRDFSEPGAASDLSNERTMAARDGDFEALDDRAPTLGPILSQEVAARFLRCMKANHHTFHAGETQTKPQMNGTQSQQKTIEYKASTFDELRRKFATAADPTALGALLRDTGCLPFLEAA